MLVGDKEILLIWEKKFCRFEGYRFFAGLGKEILLF